MIRIGPVIRGPADKNAFPQANAEEFNDASSHRQQESTRLTTQPHVYLSEIRNRPFCPSVCRYVGLDSFLRHCHLQKGRGRATSNLFIHGTTDEPSPGTTLGMPTLMLHVMKVGHVSCQDKDLSVCPSLCSRVQILPSR